MSPFFCFLKPANPSHISPRIRSFGSSKLSSAKNETIWLTNHHTDSHKFRWYLNKNRYTEIDGDMKQDTSKSALVQSSVSLKE
jgi:hypothetical protein